jgi:hypothetical protein
MNEGEVIFEDEEPEENKQGTQASGEGAAEEGPVIIDAAGSVDPDHTMRNIIIAVVVLLVLVCCCCVLFSAALSASGVFEEIMRGL